MTTFIKYQVLRFRDVYVVTHLRKTSFFYDRSIKHNHTSFKARCVREHEDYFKVSDLPLEIKCYFRDLLDN